jgi:hypothetical protein
LEPNPAGSSLTSSPSHSAGFGSKSWGGWSAWWWSSEDNRIRGRIVRCNLLILSRFLPDCSQGVVVVVSIAAHPWHCSNMALGLSRSRSRQPCPWLTSAVLGVVGAVLSHTSGIIVGERLVYISMQCNQSKGVSLPHIQSFRPSTTAVVCACVCWELSSSSTLEQRRRGVKESRCSHLGVGFLSQQALVPDFWNEEKGRFGELESIPAIRA